jgi:hypothetical protein
MAKKRKPDTTSRFVPDTEFRFERIKVAIWDNRTRNGSVWFSIQPTSPFNEGEQLHDATKCGRDDLRTVALAIKWAFKWIWGQNMPTDCDPREA